MTNEYSLEQPITVGSIWRNNDPYPGECSIIIGMPVDNMPGFYECIKCDCNKYPELKGTVEYKHIDDILTYYHIISK